MGMGTRCSDFIKETMATAAIICTWWEWMDPPFLFYLARSFIIIGNYMHAWIGPSLSFSLLPQTDIERS